MKERQQIVAGNWKMNTSLQEGKALTEEVLAKLSDNGIGVILATPFIHLVEIGALITDHPQVKLAAQNCHAAEKGAYTGEISAPMLKSAGVYCVILGHSERRKYFGETNEAIAAKVNAVLAQDLQPIVCVGEELSVREAGNHESLVADQIKTALFHLNADQLEKIIIAYEPVWAIGTGKTASPEQAQEMHLVIRNLIKEQYSDSLADGLTILYGGSVKPGNAKELFRQPDVDGGLVGGASLKADDFVSIVNSF